MLQRQRQEEGGGVGIVCGGAGPRGARQRHQVAGLTRFCDDKMLAVARSLCCWHQGGVVRNAHVQCPQINCPATSTPCGLPAVRQTLMARRGGNAITA